MWSELYPGEHINLAALPAYQTRKATLKKRLFTWMKAEANWLAGPGHHPPLASYIDGRSRSEQHNRRAL